MPAPGAATASALPVWLDWSHDKLALSLLTDVNGDVLHIMAGLLVLTAAAWLWRRPPWHWAPWLTVAIVEGINEWHDLTSPDNPQDTGNWRDSWHDFWLTMFWPTAILLFWRRWGARAPAAGAVDAVAGEPGPEER